MDKIQSPPLGIPFANSVRGFCQFSEFHPTWGKTNSVLHLYAQPGITLRPEITDPSGRPSEPSVPKEAAYPNKYPKMGDEDLTKHL